MTHRGLLGRLDEELVADIVSDVAGQDGAPDKSVLAHVPLAADLQPWVEHTCSHAALKQAGDPATNGTRGGRRALPPSAFAHRLVVSVEAPGDAAQVETGLELGDDRSMRHA